MHHTVMRQYYVKTTDSGLGSVAALCSAASPAATLHAHTYIGGMGSNYVFLFPPGTRVQYFLRGTVSGVCVTTPPSVCHAAAKQGQITLFQYWQLTFSRRRCAWKTSEEPQPVMRKGGTGIHSPLYHLYPTPFFTYPLLVHQRYSVSILASHQYVSGNPLTPLPTPYLAWRRHVNWPEN